MNKILLEVTERIRERSGPTRGDYLARIDHAARKGPQRVALGCSNLAHGMAACDQAGKQRLGDDQTSNIAIVTAYNDMLSAHRPFEGYPAIIRDEARKLGAVAFPPCATGSPRVRPAWIFRCSVAMSSRFLRPSRSPTICSTRSCVLAFATKLCRAS